MRVCRISLLLTLSAVLIRLLQATQPRWGGRDEAKRLQAAVEFRPSRSMGPWQQQGGGIGCACGEMEEGATGASGGHGGVSEGGDRVALLRRRLGGDPG